MNNTIVQVIIGILGVIAIAVIMLVLLCSAIVCNWAYLYASNPHEGIPEGVPPHCIYSVCITGFSDYTPGGNGTEVLVPAAMINGHPVFNITEATPSQDSGHWTVAMADTEHGQMIRFSTTDRHLTDIKFQIMTNFIQSSDLLALFDYAPLRPKASNVTMVDDSFTYTSYVYLSPDLRTIGSGNHTLNVDIRFHGNPGPGNWGNEYCDALIKSNISEVERGFVPVQVTERAYTQNSGK